MDRYRLVVSFYSGKYWTNGCNDAFFVDRQLDIEDISMSYMIISFFFFFIVCAIEEIAV